MIIKCKMCGGDMEISADQRTGTCEYCGSTMTLPRIDDEQRAAAFNRGNHFRRIGEFDKALAVYEGIVREDETDAEAHWCCALCRFGIEYVKDPATGEYIPTCHRASFDSFLEDVDYKAALEHADVVAKAQYQKDGEKIAQVQRGILSISQREQPFDVFICYKESDERGNRTVDSTLAQEIYYQLTDQGRRVFFARITLEDKAGQEYEPYIFAALHSAKVMVVVGTRPEYLNAVWVRNEWSRYLALMKHDRKRLLIPCYRDMDPYDLPEQLSVLQSYDMSRIGFIQDLIRGIAKVLDADKKPETVKETIIHNEMNVNLTALLKRGRQMLEDESWEKADEFFDQALNVDAECGEAFFGKALAELKCRNYQAFIDEFSMNQELKPEDLRVPEPGEKVIKLEAGDPGKAAKSLEMAIKSGGQPPTVQMGDKAEACPQDRERIERVAVRYAIPGYLTEEEIQKDFDEGNMRKYISAASIRRIYQLDWETRKVKNKNLVRAKQYAKGDFAEELEKIYTEIDRILNQRLREAEERDAETEKQIKKVYEEFLQKVEQLAKEKNGLAQARRETDYLAACVEEENAKDIKTYRLAAEKFEKIGDYKDCKIRAEECRKEGERIHAEVIAWSEREKKQRFKKIAMIGGGAVAAVTVVAIAMFVNATVIQPLWKYGKAQRLMEEGNYAEAYSAFDELRGYKGIDEEFLKGVKYEEGQNLMAEGNYVDAYQAFEQIRGYKDVDELLEPDDSEYTVGSTIVFGNYEQDNNTDNGAEEIEWIVLERMGNVALLLSKNALDAQPYHEDMTSITWEKCTLRQWLNEDFINQAFSKEERAVIQTTEVDNSKEQGYNPWWESEHGMWLESDTKDQIFLLSYKEAFKDYFSDDASRICTPTDYAIAQGAFTSDEGNCTWWLRLPRANQDIAAKVRADGSYDGGSVYFDDICIRPALWINLESDIF